MAFIAGAPMCISRSERYLMPPPTNCKSTQKAKRPFGCSALPPVRQDRLESDLGTHRQRVESRADIAGVSSADLFDDIAVKVVEHKADVAIDVPVEARGVDRLPAAGDA